MRTHGAHGVVVAYDDERRDVFLATDEGAEYTADMERRIMSAFDGVFTSGPTLRLLPGQGEPSS